MMKNLFIVSFILFTFAFSDLKNNPFIGFWKMELTEYDEESALVIFEDSTMSYSLSAFGDPIIPMGSNKYTFTATYFISYLDKKIDTSLYFFKDSNTLILIDLEVNDTITLKKIIP